MPIEVIEARGYNGRRFERNGHYNGRGPVRITERLAGLGQGTETVYGSLPANEIQVVNEYTASEYLKPLTTRVKSAFVALQRAVGTTPDGAIGGITARAVIAKLDKIGFVNLPDYAQRVLATWQTRSQRPFVVGAYADLLAAYLMSGASTTLAPLPPRTPAPAPTPAPPAPVAQSPAPSAPRAGWTTGQKIGLVAAGLGAVGMIALLAKGKKGSPRRRAFAG